MGNLLPPSSTPLERAAAASLSALGGLKVPLRDLWDPAAAPVELLPWLAWTVAVDDWDHNWDEATKRSVIADQVALHRKRGTVWSVVRAVQRSGLTAEIIERPEQRRIYAEHGALRLDGTWKVNGTHAILPIDVVAGIPQIQSWAQFIIRLDLAQAQRPDAYEKARRLVDAWKPARSWPIYAYVLRLLLLIDIRLHSSLLMQKESSGRYPWCGRVIGVRPDAVWSLGKDGEFARLPRPFGSFKLGQLTGEISSWRLKPCRVTSSSLMTSLTEPIAVGGVARLGQKDRRVDGSWRLAAKTIDAGSHAFMRSLAASSVRPSMTVTSHDSALLPYPFQPRRLSNVRHRLASWMRLDGGWGLGALQRRLPFGFPLGRDTPILVSSRAIAEINGGASIVGPRIGLGQLDRRLDGSWRLSGRDTRMQSAAQLDKRVDIQVQTDLRSAHVDHFSLTYPGARARLGGTFLALAPWNRLDGSWQVGGVRRHQPFGFSLARDTPVIASGRTSIGSASDTWVSCERLGLLRATKLALRPRRLDGSWRLGLRRMSLAPRIGGFRVCYEIPGARYEPFVDGARRLRLDRSWTVGGPAKPHSSIRTFKGAA